MTDFILDLGSATNATAAFKSLGFWDAQANAPITQGVLGAGATQFFMVVDGIVSQPTGQMTTEPMTGQQVPVMAPVPGYWARLRILGANPFQTGALTPPASVMIYSQVDIGTPTAPDVIWTSDGTTPAPACVGSVGVIA